jgi:cell division protein ZipA
MDLQLVLIILGATTIVGVCIHGIYVSRKSSTPQKHWSQEQDDFSAPQINHDAIDLDDDIEPEFDEFGLGKARLVVSKSSNDDALPHNIVSMKQTDEEDATSMPASDVANEIDIPSVQDEAFTAIITPKQNDTAEVDTTPLYESVVSKPKPQMNNAIYQDPTADMPSVSNVANEATETKSAQQQATEEELGFDISPPPASFMQADPDTTAESSIDEGPISESPGVSSEPLNPVPSSLPNEAEPEPEKTSIAQAAMNLMTGRKQRATRKTTPKVDVNQLGIDFDSVDPVINETKAIAENKTPVTDIEPEFLAINLRVPKEQQISGAQLLPALITLGMKYGENNIFHRHVNTNGKGPIVFSLANLYKPGTFDLDNMEKESIRGLSIFMTLPTESDAHQVFNMMHNAARKLAEEFKAEILDDSRCTLTQQGLQQYVERIRDFERRRLLGQ